MFWKQCLFSFHSAQQVCLFCWRLNIIFINLNEISHFQVYKVSFHQIQFQVKKSCQVILIRRVCHWTNESLRWIFRKTSKFCFRRSTICRWKYRSIRRRRIFVRPIGATRLCSSSSQAGIAFLQLSSIFVNTASKSLKFDV